MTSATNVSSELLHPPPPLPIVKEFGRMLCTEVAQATVLDLGCGTGRNSRFLAELGHTVIGVTDDFTEAQAASQLSANINCSYVVGDARELPFKHGFNVVIANEVFHLMSKDDSRAALDKARDLTMSKGLHVVSGYLADDLSLDLRNQQRCFRPGELLRSYEDAGWRTLSYDETRKRPTYFNNQELVNSIAAIIARKP